MLIYSPATEEMSQNVPNKVKKPSDEESKNYQFRGEARKMINLSRNKWTNWNNHLVTETIIIIISLLFIGCFRSIDCNSQEKLDESQQVEHNQFLPGFDHSRIAPNSERKISPPGRGSNILGTTFGSRISQMFASLGPRLHNSGAPMTAGQESAPPVSFNLFEPTPIGASEPTNDHLVGLEAKKGPPIYRSAPKQIIEIHEEPKKAKKKKESIEVEIEKKPEKRKIKTAGVNDLHSAAGYQQRRRTKKPKKKHAYPSHYTYFGKYHEHRSVPDKDAWEFGYKRGNSKHTIEREEHGHKSHFKTEVKWKDKKGKGHHLFDYNHSDSKKKAKYPHYAAASKRVTQRKSHLTIGDRMKSAQFKAASPAR